MADKLHLEIVTPQEILLETEADWVTVPGAEGEFGVLPEHVPLVATLDSGILQFQSDGTVSRVAVHYGYAQVRGATVTVLSEMAERPENIDLARARDAEGRARQTLQELAARQDEEESRLKKFQCKLERALVRQSLGQ